MKKLCFTIFFLINCFFLTAFAELPKTGIGIRGVYWDNGDNSSTISVSNQPSRTEVKTGGFGGSIFFLTRIQKQIYAELSIGGNGRVENYTEYWHGEEVNSISIVPILMGINYYLLSSQSASSLQPYFSIGGGVYWLSKVRVEERYFNDEVNIETSPAPGGYAGFGLQFMLSRKFSIHYDMRYHLTGSKDDRYRNNFEFGLGCSLMWGK